MPLTKYTFYGKHICYMWLLTQATQLPHKIWDEVREIHALWCQMHPTTICGGFHEYY